MLFTLKRGMFPQKGQLLFFKGFIRRHYLSLFSLSSFGSSLLSLGKRAIDRIKDTLAAAITAATKFGDWFVDGVKSIIALFGSVLDFVAAMRIKPIVSFLAAIIDVAINAICYIMTVLANSALTLFKPDIGTGSSMFELILKGYSGFFSFLRVMAIAFIFIILVSSLCKIMFHESSDETPMSVFTGAFVAGFFSSIAPFLVVQAEKVFLVFYSGLLGMVPQKTDFEKFASAAHELLSTADTSKLGAQLESFCLSFLLLMLIMMIAWKFVVFLMEVAQRYLVLGMLLLFSPLACCFITTKSMRNSFKAYIRMIASTLILMLMNVFFLALFLKSVTGFSGAVTSISAANSSASKVVIVIVWCLVEFGVLHVAGQMDNYMNTLGISTAETGSGMMASMLMDAMDIGAIGMPQSKKEPKEKKGLFGLFSRSKESSVDSQDEKGPITATHGKVDPQVVLNALHRKTGNMSLFEDGATAAAAADALLNALGDEKLKDKRFDGTNFDIKNGMAMLDTAKDKDGNSLSIALAPVENLPPGFARQYGGREIDIGSQGKYVLIAMGQGASEYLAQSSKALAAFQKDYGLDTKNGQISRIRDANNQITGAYRQIEQRDNGVMLTEWAPACSYRPDEGLNASLVRVGDMDFWRSEVFMPKTIDASGAEHLSLTCENTSIPDDANGRQKWFSSQFSTAAQDGFRMVGGTAEQLHLEKNGEKFVMNSVLSCSISEKAEENLKFTRYYAENGVGYMMTKVPDFEQTTIDKVFVNRNTQGMPMFAQKFDMEKAMDEAVRRRYVTPLPSSNIQKTAYKKTRGDK